MKKWIAITKDNKTIDECECNWKDIESEIRTLYLNNDSQIIKLPDNMEKYVQAKTASANLGSNNISIESRYIGFKLGNNIVKIRVCEKTNHINVEVEKL